MNKPVFDKSLTIESLSVEPTDLGNMLDDTLTGGVAPHTSSSDEQIGVTSVDDRNPVQAPIPDFLVDENDGRRSIAILAADVSAADAIAEDTSVSHTMEKSQDAPLGISAALASSIDARVDGNADKATGPATDPNGDLATQATGLGDADRESSLAALAYEQSSPTGNDTALAAPAPSNGSPSETATNPGDLTAVYGLYNTNDTINYGSRNPGTEAGYAFYGRSGNDTIIGSKSNDWLHGDEGDDVLSGGVGHDTYSGGGGYDVIDYSLYPTQVGIYVNLYGSAKQWNGIQIQLDRIMDGNPVINGPNTPYGAGQDYFVDGDIDEIIGTEFEDQFWHSSSQYPTAIKFSGWYGNDVIYSTTSGDTLDGGYGADNIYGVNVYMYGFKGFEDNLVDTLIGGDGNEWIEGGLDDIMFGGKGNDTLVGAGWVHYDKVLTYVPVAANRDINLITGKATDGGYTDTLINVWKISAGDGNDTLTANTWGVYFDGGNGNDTFFGNAGNDTMLGAAGDDVFFGSLGSDYLDGGLGSNVLVYFYMMGISVDIDLSNFSAWKSNGQMDSISGMKDVWGTDGGDDIIRGDSQNNHFWGGKGGDILNGAAGNDTLEGGDGNDRLSGGADNDSLLGGDGNDTLDGAAGGDTMAGGLGDDIYYVDSIFDRVIENGNEGTDTVYSTISYDISSMAIENVTLMGKENLGVLGNYYDNILIGNDGNNEINGGAGADTMIGGLGDDIYYITDIGDVPQEYNGKAGGIDTAYVWVNNFDARKLANIENIILGNGVRLDNPPGAPSTAEGGIIDENATGPAVRIQSTDLEGDVVRYELLSHQNIFSIDPATGWISLNTAIDFENPPAGIISDISGSYFMVEVRAVETGAGQLASASSFIKIAINNIDEAPSAPDVVPNTLVDLYEDAPAGTPVAQLHSVDPEGKGVFFAFAENILGSDAGGRFWIINDQIQLRTSVDYEATPDQDPYLKSDGAGNKWYELWVVANDIDGEITTSEPTKVIIKVLNVNEPPTAPTYTGTPTVAENDHPTTQLVRVSSTDPEGQASINYYLANDADANPGNRFVVDISGKIFLATGVTLDYEAKDLSSDANGKYYTVKVVAKDTEGKTSAPTPVKIYVTNVDEAPNAPSYSGTPTVAEKVHPATPLVTVGGSVDPDGKAIHYALSGDTDANPGGRFVVNADGTITLAQNVTLDYEAKDLSSDANGKYYTVKVMAVDADGTASTVTPVKIYVTNDPSDDPNYPPSAPTYSGEPTWAEDTSTNVTLVQIGGSVDPEGEAVTYALSTSPQSNPGGLFAVSADGKVTLAAGKSLNYEGLPSDANGRHYYIVKVVAKDTHGNVSADKDVIIYVTDVDEAPSAPGYGGPPTWAEGTPTTTTLVQLGGAKDPEGKAVTYAFSNAADANPGNRFAVSSDGKITLAAGQSLDYEAKDLLSDANGKYYIVKVVAKDPALHTSAESAIKIYVSDVNEAPNAPSYSGTPTVAENDHPAAPLVTVGGSVDPEGTAVHYILSGDADANPGGRFVVNGDGTITLAQNVTLDYEAKDLSSDANGKYYTVKVMAVDADGKASTVTPVKIYVTNVNEAPTEVGITDGEILDNAKVGDYVAKIDATDPDGDPLIFQFKWSDNTYHSVSEDNAFKIASDGTITVNDESAIHVDGEADLPFTVAVSDGHGGMAEQVLAIHVIHYDPGNQAPTQVTFTDGTNQTHVAENVRGAVLGTLLGVDPDNSADSLTYSIADGGDPNGYFEVVGRVLKLKDWAVFDYEKLNGNKYVEVMIRAQDPQGEAVEQFFRIYVDDDPNPDTDPLNHDPSNPTFITHKTEASVLANVDGAFIGVLTATDPDANDQGQLVYELLSDPSHKFVVTTDGMVQLKDNMSLDAVADANRTIKVRVWDAHGGYADQDLTIHAMAASSNTAPHIDVNGPINFNIEDVATVAPFQNLVFGDAEDDVSGAILTVYVGFRGQFTGKFENLPVDLPPGVEFVYTPDDSILVKGTHDQVTSILRQLQFNPNDREANAGDEPSNFTVVVFDSNETPSEPVNVQVTATATGQTNHSPVIEVDQNGWYTNFSVYDLDTIAPFQHLSIKDQDLNDTLTVTVSWAGADGTFDISNAGSFGVSVTPHWEDNQLVIQGSQTAITNFLRQVQFSPDDFPNDAYQTGHDISFIVDVKDQHGAEDSLGSSGSVLTQNRAPDQVFVTSVGGHPLPDDPIREDIGVNNVAGTLSGHDPNVGDVVRSYRPIDMADGKFDIQFLNGQWVIVVTGKLDYEDIPASQRDDVNHIGYYTITVAATDQRGLESEPLELKIWVKDIEPDNSAPEIRVDTNGTTEWFVDDTETVAPMHDLTIYDKEDLASDSNVFVAVALDDPMSGKLIAPDEAGFPDLEIVKSDDNVTINGLQGRVTEYLKQIVFNPANNLSPQGSQLPLGITVTAYDSTFAAMTQKHVTVNTNVTNGVDNADPTIEVDPLLARTETTDWAKSPVNPFGGVTLKDDDSGSEELILKIGFNKADGTLNGLEHGGAKEETADRITWTFHGTLADLQTVLGLLTFDATERNQAGGTVTTWFTITLDDGHHAFPAKDEHVNVVTTITGPGSGNDLYEVTFVGQTFGENKDPEIGGFDKAIVKISEHYTLDDDDGIEVLQAWDGLTDGINVTGNNLSNTIIGGDHNDILDGGSAGQDVLRGGLGDDTYVINRASVTIEEDSTENGGIDTVMLTGDAFAGNGYTLGQFLENLDASAATGTMILSGNELGNIIIGNKDHNVLQGFDGDDTLDGGSEGVADILDGGSGNDTYKIRHLGDSIVEGAGDAFDVAEIYFKDEYRLKADAQVEVLRAGASFTEGVHLIGNAYSSVILGSGALGVSDTLDGGTGVGIAHVLAGGDGDDTYIIVNVDDEIEGERDLADTNDDGKLHGDHDIAILYRGLYATNEALQAKIDYYMSKGIEFVQVQDGVPQAPDNAAPTNVRLSNDTLQTSVNENSLPDTSVGIVVADDVPDSNGMTFEIFQNDIFGIHEDTGEIYVIDQSKLDREQVGSYVVHVRAKDAGGLYSAWRDITITLDDVNEAADRIDFGDIKNIHVGDGANALVVKATAHDPDIYTVGFQTNLYRFQNGQGPDGTISADGLFKIDKDTGQVTLNDGITLSKDDIGLHTIAIVAYDGALVSQAFSFDVVVQDTTGNTPPTNVRVEQTNGLSINVDENTPDSALDYKIVADDDKVGLKYYAEDNAFVVVDEATGQIHLKDGFQLDYEATATFSFKVYAKDTDGAVSDVQTITVTLNDKNDGPESVSVTKVADIHVGAGTSNILVANAFADDKDNKAEFLQNHFKFLYGNGGSGTTSEDGLFIINDKGEIITARDVTAADQFSHNLKVVAYDDDGHSVETTYTVDVGASSGNTAPTDLNLSGNWAREWARDGFVIGSFLPTDSDGPSGSYSYKFVLGTDASGNAILSDTDADGRFVIDGDRLLVGDGTKLDFEVARSHKILVQVSDDSGTFQKELTITVRDLLNETGTGREVSESFKGGAGDDVFDGRGGDDTLSGGFGSDDLTGGAGHDAFVFDKGLIDGEFDTIRDFTQGEDTIWLKADVFGLDGLEGGPLNDDVFAVGSAATTETQRIIYDKDNATLLYDEDGSGEIAAMVIAVFDPEHIPDLKKFDFLVI